MGTKASHRTPFVVCFLLVLPMLVFSGCGDSDCDIGCETDGGGPIPSNCVLINFENLTTGSSVEGLGKVHPDLNISTVGGTAIVIAEGDAYNAYGAPNDAIMSEGCIGKPGSGLPVAGRGKGFSDIRRNHNYVFMFSPDKKVTEFSVTMLDFGDLNSMGQAYHEVNLIAYDAFERIVDKDVLSYYSSTATNPRTSDFGDLWYTGDACTARAGPPNKDPGIWTFKVSGAHILKVKFMIVAGIDPNIAFDNIRFCVQE